MVFNPDIHNRRSIRLKGYDYSQSSAYFVTICTKNRECLYGNIMNGVMVLNEAGNMVQKAWDELPVRFPTIESDAFIVMPNHIHGIIMLVGAPLVGAPYPKPQNNRAGTRPAPTLGEIAGIFKSVTTHQYTINVSERNWTPFSGKLWQRNYHEHIIRSDKELNRIREYIINNPLRWHLDRDNLDGTPDENENKFWKDIS